jgi:amino acid adenylation domain-containing protein/FkbM family methyltransferase
MELEIEEPLEGFRLSPQQRRLWEARRRQGGDWQRTLAAATVEGPLDPAALRSAMMDLVGRHEILRTRIGAPAGAALPLQVIGRADVAWPAVEPAAGGGEHPDERIAGALRQAAGLPVDPVRGPLLQALLTPLAPQRHLLVVVLPALLSDAAGAVNLLRELARAHAAPGQGGAAAADVLQYADLAEWLNERLESAEAAAGQAFWDGLRWAGLPAAGLPFGPRPRDPGFTPAWRAVDIGAATSAGLAAVAASHGASPRALLLACWQALLARLGGGAEFVIGAAYDGRRHAQLRGAVGPLSWLLPVPCRWRPDLPFDLLLAQAVELDAGLAQWQESFAADAGAELPLAAVRYGFAAAGRGDVLAAGAATWRLERAFSCDAPFALALEGCLAGGGLAAELRYAAAVFTGEEIDLLAARFACLLDSVAARPGAPLGSLAILPEQERLRIIAGFNPAPSPRPAAGSLLEMFGAWAKREPDRLALASGGRSLTYRELDAWSGRLARHLRALGADPEARVAICLDRCLELVVALLATLKTGASFVPLDPAFPRERIAQLLADSRARLLISMGAAAAALPAAGARVVALDTEAEAIAHQPDGPLGVVPAPATLAYVIFTSGSTGRAKGVGVAHRQLSRYVESILARLNLADGASFAMVSTPAADLGYTAVFPALASGGCLHVIAADVAADAVRLADYFHEHEVDVLKITPSHLSALLAAAPSRDLLPRRRLVLGGEAASWDLIERAAALAPGCVIFNHYGPTESTVGVATHRIEAGEADAPSGSVPIGRPLEHARLYLLDGAGSAVPLGAAGEIHIGGGGLARGYLDDPCRTAERFLPDPHAAELGARAYRTGDRGRWLLSGEMEFLGRVDDQLKVRGYRVEPGEIEHALERHPAVAAAKVIGRTDGPSGLALAAYVVLDAACAGPVERLLRLRAEGRWRDQALFDLPNGMTVAHLNEGETRFLYRSIFGERTYLRHGIRIADGACVVDVGASIGLFSLLATRAAKGVRSFAFEPVPQAFRALRLNAEIHGGIRAFDYGLSRENRRAEITYYPHLTLMSSLYADVDEEREVVRSFLRHGQGGEGGEMPEGPLLEELLANRLASETAAVELRRLSDVLRELEIEHVDLLKIDVQKSECDVLAGIDEQDWPRIDQIVLEAHDVGDRVREITALLGARGFAVVVEQDRALAGTALYDIYARRPGAAGEEPPAAGESHEVPLAWSSPGALIEDLEQHLATILPSHMVPASFSLLTEFPLTANGKLDRAALPAPDTAAFDAGRTGEPPGTPTESKLAEIWAVVLGHRRFGIRDSFFKLGGHSLLATRVVARIRKAFGSEITLRDFFDDPTIAALARRVDAAEPLAASAEERITRLVRAAYQHGRPPIG